MTPLQLWVQGQLNYQPTHTDIPVNTDIEEYGIDWDGPLPSARYDGPNYENDGVIIPDLSCPLLNIEQELTRSVNPLGESESNGIDIYLHARDLIKARIESAV
eukprot:Seg3287.2 transcript_id=Seg3287.2/GoldUCD/mRNA.D3Y31 product="hypothetical protein" protein_id=Seg3287.2/GoldUCD/D3Y31